MQTQTRPQSNTTNAFELVINNPMTAYVAVITAWLFAWWIQMGPLSSLNLAPGVELPFFPAGIRTLAVFIFGIHGAFAILIGSLISYAWLFPAVSLGDYASVISIATASSFSAYAAMKGYLLITKSPADLSGLTLSKITIIVLIQSLMSSTLHQLIYQSHEVSEQYNQMNYLDLFLIWLGMAAGDLVGSMIVMLSACLIVDAINAWRSKRDA